MKTLLFLSLLMLLTTCTGTENDQALNRTIESLTAFAKVYGHVKFFHASDEAADIDWDKFAIHGVETIKKAQNERELKTALEALFTPIAPTVTIHNSEPDGDFFLPSYFEMIDWDTTGLKTIAWQHKGVYLGTDRQLYRSFRTFRSDYNLSRELRIFQNLDSKWLKGKEIRLSSSVRSLHHDEKSKAELIITSDWQNLFSEKFDLDDHQNGHVNQDLRVALEEDTEAIFVGIRLQGTIDLFIDAIELEYRSASSDWTPFPLQNSDFSRKTENILANWEIFSNGVFEYGGDETFRITSKPKLFKHFPAVGETAVQQISGGLWSEVPLALFGNDEHTLPYSRSSETKKNFSDLKHHIDQIDMDNASIEDEKLQLANIIIAWNVFQHFYPYFDVVDVNWNGVLTEALNRVLRKQSVSHFRETLDWMVAQLQDGHGVVTCEEDMPLYKPAIRVEKIAGEIVVTSSNSQSISKGEIIKSVDGQPALEELERRMELISGSPQLRKYRALNLFASGENGSLVILEIENSNGELRTKEVLRSERANLFWSRPEFEYPEILELEKDIYLVNLSKITRASFGNRMIDLSSARGIIFDYRNGGNYSFSLFDIIPYLTDDVVKSLTWHIPKWTYPDRQNVQYDHSTGSINPKKPRFKGKHVILNVPGVVSSGETEIGIIDHYQLASTVGQPTAGTNGNSNLINLPGNCRIMWTGMKVLKHDDSQLHLKGYISDYPVERTIEAVRENRDEFLEKAIEIIQSNDN